MSESAKAKYRAMPPAERAARRAKAMTWKRLHRGRFGKYQKEWHAAHRARELKKMKARRLWRHYQITPRLYAEMREAQRGLCAICGIKPSKKLVVDHDHSTGHIRGLLCAQCNTGLGLFKDNARALHGAIEYLRSADKGSATA
jgi:hypothetical protein